MNNDFSRPLRSNRAITQVAHPQASTPVHLPSKVWSGIVVAASADLILTLRQAAPEMRDIHIAVNDLAPADLKRINERSNSTVDLCKLEDEVIPVTRAPGDRAAIASDANTSPALQRFLANRDNPFNGVQVRRALAENPNLTVELQQTLAQDDEEWVRVGLAGNANLTNVQAQQALAQDDEEWVRGELADNPNLTVEAQQILVQDDDASVRGSLARNPNLTIDIQRTLARDGNSRVRRHLANNPYLAPVAEQLLAQRTKKSRIQ